MLTSVSYVSRFEEVITSLAQKRVPVDVVFVARFPLNRRSFFFTKSSRIINLFCLVTLLASASNHNDDDKRENINKKVTGLISKRN